jgi:hypothetical protein
LFGPFFALHIYLYTPFGRCNLFGVFEAFMYFGGLA